MNIVDTNFKYRKPLIPLNLSKVQYIVIHHPEWINASPEDIHNDVLNDPAKSTWSGFPYNAYVRKDGTINIGRGFHIGAQCENMNSITYGVSFEGNYDIEESMPDAQFKAGVEFIKYIMPNFPNLKAIKKHSELNSTQCPGRYFPFDRLIKSINGREVKQMNGIAAVNYLNSKGKILDVEYWIKAIYVVRNLDSLLVKWAEDVQKMEG